MEETYLLKHPGVKKKILHGGQGSIPHFPPGTKLVFHFQTLKDDFERTVIDDSRKAKQPMEIFVGKMFKMEVWEVLLTSMRVGEVAEFWCDAIHTGLYPIVSKGMRLIAEGRDPLEGQKHMCGMGNMFHYNSTGFPDLDELMKEPQPLIFIMELISVGDPFSYKRESWMMEKDEKLQAVPSLHLQGNALVKQGRFREAATKYQEAVFLLRTVQSREMPGHEDYINLDRLITPLVLNYCQCMLELEEYYEVLEHTTELLEKHKDIVKAYYKRAKAHAAVWNEKEARKDFLMVANLDVTLAPLVKRELRQLGERMREKYWEEKNRYWGILGEKKQGEEEEEGKQGESFQEKEEVSTSHSGVSQDPKEETQNKHRDVTTKDDAVNEGTTSSCGEQQPTNRSNPPVAEQKDWQQMLRLVPLLHDEGNFLIKEERYMEAAEKYKEAIEYVNYLQTKEVKCNGEDWESLEKVRLPLTLNLSQCMLELGEYYKVLEINNKLLKKHKGNLKAVYQRARAHSALSHEQEARRDFKRVSRLDPKFKPIVQIELRKMGENIRAKHARQKKNYWAVSMEKREAGKKGKVDKTPAHKANDRDKSREESGTAANDEGSKAGREAGREAGHICTERKVEVSASRHEERAESDHPAGERDSNAPMNLSQTNKVRENAREVKSSGAAGATVASELANYREGILNDETDESAGSPVVLVKQQDCEDAATAGQAGY